MFAVCGGMNAVHARLQNHELIAIHQDDLGVAGDRLWGAASQLQVR